MAENPLLVFPTPTTADRATLGGGGNKLSKPSHGRQGERLTPQFERLQQAMERRRGALQGSTAGIQPEQVLIIETVSGIQNFHRAVIKIEGLEWLFELELDEIDPDHGFEVENKPEKKFRGQLFLVMTDQRALTELKSLFDRWKADQDVTFERGLAPWKQAFEHIRDIRAWGVEDRIRDTGLLDDWRERVEEGEESVPFEVELWYRQDEAKRASAESQLTSMIAEIGGDVVSSCVLPDIWYHALLGTAPIAQAQSILQSQDVKLFQSDAVMHFRPIGQCLLRSSGDWESAEEDQFETEPLDSSSEPVVALLDGLPLAGHVRLRDRLIIDDPDSYEDDYQASERVHGTAMASLVLHGELDTGGVGLARKVYIRPILSPRRFLGKFMGEEIPQDILPVDLIHRAVLRIFEGEGEESPAAPRVKVINLSVCDGSRPFDIEISAWARLIDWLSRKYNVLFIVSAGNSSRDIELNTPKGSLGRLTRPQLQDLVVSALIEDSRHRRILSPAESINALTVGASHEDGSSGALTHQLIDPLADTSLPSPASCNGPGYLRAIKPDILLPGGRQPYRERPAPKGSRPVLGIVESMTRPPGVKVAVPGSGGTLNGTAYMRGTSSSAALATRAAALLVEQLESLADFSGNKIPDDYYPVLLKSLLGHSSSWSGADAIYWNGMANSYTSNHPRKEMVGRFLGYGVGDPVRVMGCTERRVTVLGFGELMDGQAQEFRFPLPPNLASKKDRRRLTVTLAWLTPITPTRQRYRNAHLWFDPKNSLAPDRVCASDKAAKRGTLQHEILEGRQAVPYSDGATIALKVNCRSDAGDIVSPVRYGLAVTLEVGEEVEYGIYTEVRDRLRTRVKVEADA